MRTLAIRHVGFEHLDLLEDILNDRGHEVRYLDAGVRPLDDVDPMADHLVVVLGGPIGVYEREAYPFLDAEVEFIARRLGARRPTLGICLGAQIMAAALGACLSGTGQRDRGSLSSPIPVRFRRLARSAVLPFSIGMAIRSIYHRAQRCWRQRMSWRTKPSRSILTVSDYSFISK